jgi:preprotein translocase subunit SecD
VAQFGLDLQGGTSFMMEMDTNRLVTEENFTNKKGEL